ncbi:MAG TPA: hypothetical protein VK968_04525 [Roseimicrobium sp.]|nr:hypothetical protein [Roseimicrobium sp.]
MKVKGIRHWAAYFLLAAVVGLAGFNSSSLVSALGLGDVAFRNEFLNARKHADAVKLAGLAQEYLDEGPISSAFESLEKALVLAPDEPAIHQSLGEALFACRRDAMAYYGLSEEQIFDSAFKHLEKAMELDPENFDLAKEIANSHFVLKPIRYEAARDAWFRAAALSYTELEIQEVYLNLARLETMVGHMDLARAHIAKVTDPGYSEARGILQRQFVRKSDPAVHGLRYE